jgi:3-deoxy-D-manno-octulosonic-acid transferase
MAVLYNISTYLFLVAIKFATLFNAKARLWVKGRRSIFKKLKKTLSNTENIVWFHCASLGEFEQGKPIIKAYKKKHPTHKVLLTFFSPSGYAIRKNTPLADFVFYLPADTNANAKRFIQLVNPIKVIFIKYEFWFNYMAECKKQNIPFYSVSSIFRKEQAFFKYKWFTKQLSNVTHFFVQNKMSAELLKSIGFSNTTISGDSRFDSVLETTRNPKQFPLIEDFCKCKPTIICGSTWPKDEILLAKYIKENPQYNYIIAPHELHYISKLQKQTNALLFSKSTEQNIFTSNILIIDSIGILSHIYSYGSIAYIGGGFGSGIHNILEAITFGLPVVFGPNYKKVNEAKGLINIKSAVSVKDYSQLKKAFSTFKKFDNSIATNYIKENSGATDIICNNI